MNFRITIAILVAFNGVFTTPGSVCGQVLSNDVKGRVIDDQLIERRGHPITMDGTNILLFDQPGGVPSVLPLRRAIVLVVGESTYRGQASVDRYQARRAGDLDPIRSRFIETTDGQRIPGSLVRDGDGRMSWRSAWLPNLKLDPEKLKTVRLQEDAEILEAEDADLVLLANGDRIEGLVESIGASLVVELVGGDRDGDVLEVPIERVASISLVNPPVEPKGVMVWYRGGHRLLGSGLDVEDDGYSRLRRPALGGDVSEVPSEYLVGVSFVADQVRPWSSLEWTREPGSAELIRPWIPPITRMEGHYPISAAPLRIPGGMKASAELPWDRARFRVVVERAPDAGSGSCTFIVRDGDREVSRQVVDPARPVVVVTGEVDEGPLVFEVDPGEDGPFDDDVVLREALLMRMEG